MAWIIPVAIGAIVLSGLGWIVFIIISLLILWFYTLAPAKDKKTDPPPLTAATAGAPAGVEGVVTGGGPAAIAGAPAATAGTTAGVGGAVAGGGTTGGVAVPKASDKQVLIPPTTVIDILESKNIPFTKIPLGINYAKVGSEITFTFSFDIIIEKNANTLAGRSIMYHGTETNVKPRTTWIYSKHPSIALIDNEFTNNHLMITFGTVEDSYHLIFKTSLSLKKKYTITVVINDNTIYLYNDGIKDKEFENKTPKINLKWDSSVNDKWIWNSNTDPNPNNGFIKISNVNWWNIALSYEEVVKYFLELPAT